MRPTDALEMQAQLRSDLADTRYLMMADRMLASMEWQQRNQVGLLEHEDPAVVRGIEALEGRGLGETWIAATRRCLGLAETFIVAEHMNGLIRMAAADYPEDEPLTPDLVPSPDGFMVFEKAWEMIDARGNQLLVKAVTWQTVPNQGVRINEFSSLTEPDSITKTIMRESPQAYQGLRQVSDLQLQHTYSLSWGQTMARTVSAYVGEELAGLRDTAVGPAKAMLATWHFMREPYVDVNRHTQRPKAAATWRRKKIPGQVSVITLRQRYEPTGARGEGMTHDHRWPVRGHWAWRWAGSEKLGTRNRRRVYIAPFLKGPEGAPIKVSKHVHRLTR